MSVAIAKTTVEAVGVEWVIVNRAVSPFAILEIQPVSRGSAI